MEYDKGLVGTAEIIVGIKRELSISGAKRRTGVKHPVDR
jgi:hypothetical protein